MFEVYGSVQDIHTMPGKSRMGNHKMSAFIRYGVEEHANHAIASMNTGYEIRPGEGNIIVKQALDRRNDSCKGYWR